jgi:hypothetical protein
MVPPDKPNVSPHNGNSSFPGLLLPGIQHAPGTHAESLLAKLLMSAAWQQQQQGKMPPAAAAQQQRGVRTRSAHDCTCQETSVSTKELSDNTPNVDAQPRQQQLPGAAAVMCL